MCMNCYVSGNFDRKNLLYIDGFLHTHGNIEGFINRSTCSLFSTNFSFEEHFNDEEFFMKIKASRFGVVHEIRSFSHGD